MSQRSPYKTQLEPSFTPVQSGLLQRRYSAYGQRPIAASPQTSLQRYATASAQPAAVPPLVHGVLRSPGQPLDRQTRAFMESRFGHDFSQVRVHTNPKAAESSKSVNALAYTVGHNIVFGTGQYSRSSAAGQKLLAHELAHVVQQSGHGAFPPLPTSTFETEAEQASQTIISGHTAPKVNLRAGFGLARTPLPKNLSTLSDDELQAEHALVQDWLLENPNHADHTIVADYFRDIEAAAAGRVADPTSGPPPSLGELLDYNNPRSWHRSLPSSTIPAGRISYIGGTGRRGTPRLGRRYPPRPAIEPMADTAWQTVRQTLIDDIRSRLTGITAPTPSGGMGIYHGGYAYMARNYREGRLEQETSRLHHEFMTSATLASIGFASPNSRITVLWQQFQRIITQEGDTSAINAWDDQIVTIGAGFSAKTGAAGEIYNRMPSGFRQQLYTHGIRVNPDNTFTVLDLDRGMVETGENALRLLQVNPTMLALLTRAAQSETLLQQGGEERSQRSWMLRAQFQQFLKRNRDVPDSVFGWNQAAMQFAFKLKHWSGALSWRQMGSTGGDVNALANYALRTVHRARGGDWREAYIQGRILGIADRSSVARGDIQFGSRGIEITLE